MRALVLVFLAAGCASPTAPQNFDGGEADFALDEDLAAAADLAPDGDDGAAAPGDLAGADDLASGCGVGQLVVNEVQTSGSGGGFDEWVELYNPCANPVNVGGCKVAYRSATNSTPNDTSTVAALTGTIAARGWLLIANSAYSGGATPDVKPFAGGGLADTGGAVGLRDSAGKLIDSMGWGSAANPFVEMASATNGASGQSMARSPNGADSNDNSHDFKVAATPTPRAANQ